MVFKSCSIEMERRYRAFLTFETTLFLGFVFPQIGFIIQKSIIHIGILFVFGILMLLFGILFRLMFDKQKASFVSINDTEVRRNYDGKEEFFKLADILRVSSRVTTRGNVREVKISFVDKSATFVNGLEDTEAFERELLASIGQSESSRIYEHIDYDHKLFYIILGSIVGLSSGFFMNFVTHATFDQMMMTKLLLISFTILVSLFCIVFKPIRSRYGKAKAHQDVILGLVLFCLSIVAFFM